MMNCGAKWTGVLALGASIAPVALVAQATTGIITGRVTDRASGQPIGAAQVQIVGTQRGAATADNGTFRITGVPAGTYQLRALRIGYQAVTQSVTVATGQTVTANFSMASSAVNLDIVTVTATGTTTRAREQGSNIAVVQVDQQPLAAVTNFGNLVAGRAAGVTVIQSSGTTGTGSRVRIRGANSVNQSNEPLLIIDGVRIDPTANSGSIAVGGQTISRLNDIKPEDIETFEILKGPAATGLYGTQAANGVIQITTRRGAAGKPQLNVFGDLGAVRNFVTYPGNYTAYGRSTTGANAGQPITAANRNPGNSGTACALFNVAAGSCAVDSITARTPLNVDGVSPIVPGNRNRIGGSLRGGGDIARYFLSADGESERGPFRSNTLTRRNYRANIDASPVSGLNIGVSTGYLSSLTNLPQGDNNGFGLVPTGLIGQNGGSVVCSPATPCGTPGTATFDTTSRGYLNALSPEALNQLRTPQRVERFTSALNANYTPARLNWLTATATLGADVNSRDDQYLQPPNTIPGPIDALGSRTRNKFTIGTYTMNGSAQANFRPLESLTSQTTVGVQYQRDNLSGNRASGIGLAGGTSSLAGTTQQFTVGENNDYTRLFGVLVQQQVGWRDRLFLTVGLRGDRNSAFGSNLGFVTFPSAQASYVLTEESFFPKNDVLTSVKLRAATGQSGLRPGVYDALTYFTPVAATIAGQSVGGFTIGGVGLTDLRPERVTEVEGGFDLGFFNGRVSLEATYFSKASRDALISFPLAASAGGPINQLQNIGRVTNKGLELSSNINAIETRNVQLSAVLNFATLENKLVALRPGLGPSFSAFGIVAAGQSIVPGYPIGSYFHNRYTYADTAGGRPNGIITPTEITQTSGLNSPAGERYIGNPLPRRTFSVQPTLTLFRNLRLQALVDYRGGFHLYNGTEQFRCSAAQPNCRALFDPSTPLDRQAAAVATRFSGTNAGYVERADFTKLREVSINIGLPESFSRRYLRSRGVSLNLAGRNLGVWTDYTGFDPELNFQGQANVASAEFLTLPPVRYYIARFNVDF